MRVPRPRWSRAKDRRKDRRDAISTRLGRLEPKQSAQPEKKAEEDQKRVEKREKRPATSHSKERESRQKEREAERAARAARAEATGPARRPEWAKKPERERKPRKRKPAGKPLAGRLSAAKRGATRVRPAASRARRSGARGLRATGARTGPALGKASARAAAAGRRAQPRIDWLVTLVPRAILWAGRALVAFAGILSSVATRLSRVITPERGIAGVIVCSAACLGVSQFVTYRGVEVGEPQYLGVSGIAPPPQTDRIDAGAAHAYLLIPVAVVAVVLAVIAVHSGRWRLARLVALAGLAGVAVSLAVDLPKGLDTGTAGIAFEGAHATLTNGFYAQLAASAVLVLCGMLLSQAVKRSAGAPRGARRGRNERSRPGTALAGGNA